MADRIISRRTFLRSGAWAVRGCIVAPAATTIVLPAWAQSDAIYPLAHMPISPALYDMHKVVERMLSEIGFAGSSFMKVTSIGLGELDCRHVPHAEIYR